MHKTEFKKMSQKKIKVLEKKFSPCRLSQYMIFCHKTHFCGRYSAPDLHQTGGPSDLRGHFCSLKYDSQACIGLVCPPARFACWGAINFGCFISVACLDMPYKAKLYSFRLFVSSKNKYLDYVEVKHKLPNYQTYLPKT